MRLRSQEERKARCEIEGQGKGVHERITDRGEGLNKPGGSLLIVKGEGYPLGRRSGRNKASETMDKLIDGTMHRYKNISTELI